MLHPVQETPSSPPHDDFVYDEMIAHTAVFTFHRPKKVAILGEAEGILQEVLKHPSIEEITYVHEKNHAPSLNKQIQDVQADPLQWIMQCAPNTFDIIIQNLPITPALLPKVAQALNSEGIFVHPSSMDWLNMHAMKTQFQALQTAGFQECQMLNFFQPSYPTGLRMLILATKHPAFKRLRESDIYNRPFSTRYYNFDTHKAALALPEFMREEIEEV